MPLVFNGQRPLVYMDSAFNAESNIAYLMSQSQPFIIAGAGARLPLFSALVNSHLPMNHHLVVRDKQGLLYSYTLADCEGMSDKSSAQLKVKVAISNAFRVGKRPRCSCVPEISRRSYAYLADVPDDVLDHMLSNVGMTVVKSPKMAKKLFPISPNSGIYFCRNPGL